MLIARRHHGAGGGVLRAGGTCGAERVYREVSTGGLPDSAPASSAGAAKGTRAGGGTPGRHAVVDVSRGGAGGAGVVGKLRAARTDTDSEGIVTERKMIIKQWEKICGQKVTTGSRKGRKSVEGVRRLSEEISYGQLKELGEWMRGAVRERDEEVHSTMRVVWRYALLLIQPLMNDRVSSPVHEEGAGVWLSEGKESPEASSHHT